MSYLPKKRVFAAVGVPPEVTDHASELFRRLKTVAAQREIYMKWVPPENWHVTVWFWGEADEVQISQFSQVLSHVAQNTSSFTLKVKGLGAFESVRSARVFWAGVSRTRELQYLHDEIGRRLQMEEELDFQPHMTLGRLKNPVSLNKLIEPFARRDFFEFQVRDLVLYESQRQNYVTKYIPLERFQLRS